MNKSDGEVRANKPLTANQLDAVGKARGLAAFAISCPECGLLVFTVGYMSETGCLVTLCGSCGKTHAVYKLERGEPVL